MWPFKFEKEKPNNEYPTLRITRSRKKKIIIVLDPGHGGSNTGCTAKDFREKEYVLNFCALLQQAIYSVSSAYNVILTRNKDEYVTLGERALVSFKNKASLHLSIHVNAAREPDLRGALVFVKPRDSVAEMVARVINRCVPQPLYRGESISYAIDNTWTQRVYNILAPVRQPAILYELGYATNPTDYAALHNLATQQGLIYSVLCGLARLRQNMEPS